MVVWRSWPRDHKANPHHALFQPWTTPSGPSSRHADRCGLEAPRHRFPVYAICVTGNLERSLPRYRDRHVRPGHCNAVSSRTFPAQFPLVQTRTDDEFPPMLRQYQANTFGLGSFVERQSFPCIFAHPSMNITRHRLQSPLSLAAGIFLADVRLISNRAYSLQGLHSASRGHPCPGAELARPPGTKMITICMRVERVLSISAVETGSDRLPSLTALN